MLKLILPYPTERSLNKKDAAEGTLCGICVLSEAQQQQHANDQKGIADVFGIIGYQKIYQNQQQNSVGIKLRQSKITAKQPF